MRSWKQLTGGELLSECQGHQQQGKAYGHELDHLVQGQLQTQAFEVGASAVRQQGIREHVLRSCVCERHDAAELGAAEVAGGVPGQWSEEMRGSDRQCCSPSLTDIYARSRQ